MFDGGEFLEEFFEDFGAEGEGVAATDENVVDFRVFFDVLDSFVEAFESFAGGEAN